MYNFYLLLSGIKKEKKSACFCMCFKMDKYKDKGSEKKKSVIISTKAKCP